MKANHSLAFKQLAESMKLNRAYPKYNDTKKPMTNVWFCSFTQMQGLHFSTYTHQSG